MSRGSEAAKQTLVHYFKLLFEASGVRWNEDNEAEIEGVVDDIIAGAMEGN